jgi:DNA-binding beta-propeller fold protein YncE
MLALIYLGLAIALGDVLCRRFFRFVSVTHRCAAATLVGVLLSTWLTYLVALAFASTAKPLMWADLVFSLTAAVAIFWLSRKEVKVSFIEPRAPGSPTWDWVALVIYFAAACWLMFCTLNFNHGDIQVARKAVGDLGPNMAIQQSFAVGHNFPPQYPLFPGERMRYHFLFYFAAGNLEFLGLNLVLSLNLLSVLSMTSMLALIMALGELLFCSRAVARIGSALFFFNGSLSFVSFLASQSSLSNAINAVLKRKEFLQSGYRYAGEDWGIWTLNVFTNQRHLAGSIGIFLIVLIFLTDRYRQQGTTNKPNIVDAPNFVEGHSALNSTAKISRSARNILVGGGAFIFAGFLLGALPFWNPPVFVGALAVLLFLFLLFPYRQYMIVLVLTAVAVALPQVWYLRSGDGRPRGYSLFHWGYVVDNPTVIKVASFLGFTFGAKWILIILALVCVSWFHRRMFIAISSLLLVAFFFRFSGQLAANHKFLNVWLIVANLFVAYGLCWLWKIKTPWRIGQPVATIFMGFIVAGGVIDLFPLHNDYYVDTPYVNDRLVKWVLDETDPRAVFLTERFFSHPILLAGRSLFYGWPIYADSAGYDTGSRETTYRKLFESKDPQAVFRLLKENHITYVAFDDGVRHGDLIKRPNEEVYARYFSKVFEDKAHKYGALTIYKVPEISPSQFNALPQVGASMLEGGIGSGKGEFNSPRGMAADMNGNIFVADTNNGRIEKFSSTGAFLSSIGTKGTGYGKLSTPNGIAIDQLGNIYVADASKDCVEKLAPTGTVVAEWKGSDPGFYGPRRIAIGPDNSIYVVDQGRNRIVKFNPEGDVLASWGSSGSGDGQFNDHTSVAVDPKTNTVFVADPINRRIQTFDSNGKFLTKWLIPEWGRAQGFEDLAIDSQASRLYASSANMDKVLVFDLNGNRIAVLRPHSPDKLEGASALAVVNRVLYVLCSSAARVIKIQL